MRTRPSPRLEAVARLVVLPLTAGLLFAWWMIGDAFSEAAGEDSIYRLPFAERHATVIGLVGFALALVALASLARYRPRIGWQPAAVALFSAGIGVIVSGGLRVITARVHGANIGGGGAIILGPFLIVPALVAAVAWAWATANLASTPDGPADAATTGRI